MGARELRRWAASLALMLPAAIPYVTHFADQRPYSLPTGYIQSDMPLYMAKAREAFDAGRFAILYGNPCDGMGGGEPRIYFQPWTFALGLIQWTTQARPSWIFVGFGFLAAWVASRVFLAVFEEYVGIESRPKRLALVAFFWGGGFLAIFGVAAGWLSRGSIQFDDLTAFDPFRGWWFLSLGRNLVYPTEALYHALAFGSFFAVARGRRTIALALASITAACSPFAGLETLAILWLAALLEVLCAPNRKTSIGFFLGVNALGAIFLTYTLGYLGRFPEHRAIAEQMSLSWRYGWPTPILAYGPVIALALWRIRSSDRLRTTFSEPRNRLLLAWAVAALALENHDLLVAPRQPIHFTRGYAWSALFLLGAPILVDGLTACRRAGRLAILGFLLLDNAAWFAGFLHDFRVPDRNGLRVSREQAEVLAWLDRDEFVGSLLVAEDERLSYLAIAETRLRSILGHPLETPDYRRRRMEVDHFFATGKVAASWRGRRLVVVRYVQKSRVDWVDHPGPTMSVRFANRRFQILQFVAGPKFTSDSPAKIKDIRNAFTSKIGFDDRGLGPYCRCVERKLVTSPRAYRGALVGQG